MKRLTSEQIKQQANRDKIGRYAEKEHSAPGAAARLHASQPEAASPSGPAANGPETYVDKVLPHVAAAREDADRALRDAFEANPDLTEDEAIAVTAEALLDSFDRRGITLEDLGPDEAEEIINALGGEWAEEHPAEQTLEIPVVTDTPHVEGAARRGPNPWNTARPAETPAHQPPLAGDQDAERRAKSAKARMTRNLLIAGLVALTIVSVRSQVKQVNSMARGDYMQIPGSMASGAMAYQRQTRQVMRYLDGRGNPMMRGMTGRASMGGAMTGRGMTQGASPFTRRRFGALGRRR